VRSGSDCRRRGGRRPGRRDRCSGPADRGDAAEGGPRQGVVYAAASPTSGTTRSRNRSSCRISSSTGHSKTRPAPEPGTAPAAPAPTGPGRAFRTGKLHRRPGETAPPTTACSGSGRAEGCAESGPAELTEGQDDPRVLAPGAEPRLRHRQVVLEVARHQRSPVRRGPHQVTLVRLTDGTRLERAHRVDAAQVQRPGQRAAPAAGRPAGMTGRHDIRPGVGHAGRGRRAAAPEERRAMEPDPLARVLRRPAGVAAEGGVPAPRRSLRSGAA
jgi:hypothetical protein